MIAASLLAAYLIARFFILFRFRVFTSYDTGSYLPRAGEGGFVAHPVSFTGHAPRLWGVPFFYAFLPSDHARALGQWVVGTAAWTVLGFGLWIHVRNAAAKAVALAAVFMLALTPMITSWDYALLSESLSISLGVLAGGLFAIWIRTTSRAALVAMTVTAFWWMFTRQDLLLLCAALVVVVAVHGLRHRERRRWAVAAALTLMLGLSWEVAIFPTIDRSYASWGEGFRVSEATLLYRIRLLVLKDRHVKAVFEDRLGMPPCPPAERFAEKKRVAIERFVFAVRSCPELLRWVRDNASNAGLRYALADPGHFAVATAKTLPMTLDNHVEDYAAPIAVLPGFVNGGIFPRGVFVLPGAFVLVALAWLLNARFGGFRRGRCLFAAGVTLIVAALGNLFISLMYGWYDFVRYGIQEAVLLRIGVVVVAVAAIDAAATYRREAAALGPRRDRMGASPPVSGTR